MRPNQSDISPALASLPVPRADGRMDFSWRTRQALTGTQSVDARQFWKRNSPRRVRAYIITTPGGVDDQ